MDYEAYDDDEDEPIESTPIPVQGFTLMVCTDRHEMVAWQDSREQCWFCGGPGKPKVQGDR